MFKINMTINTWNKMDNEEYVEHIEGITQELFNRLGDVQETNWEYSEINNIHYFTFVSETSLNLGEAYNICNEYGKVRSIEEI